MQVHREISRPADGWLSHKVQWRCGSDIRGQKLPILEGGASKMWYNRRIELGGDVVNGPNV